jgi:4-aminobutyrate aminotransferase-like enzyme
MFEGARRTLTGGVASSYQLHEPWPIYLSHGRGQRVWEVDGKRLSDFHNAIGSMVHGHAHPAISRALEERLQLGTHFAAPTEDAVVVAEELARRFGLPRWRYCNSGSEATMDAIRIARGLTGWAGDGAEDLRLVPRRPRRRDGLDRRRLRRDRRPREPRVAAVRRRHSKGDRRFDRCRSLQRRGRDGAADLAAGGATERFGVRPDW